MSPPEMQASDYGYDPAGDSAAPCEQVPITFELPPCHVIDASKLPPVGAQGTAQNPGAPGSCAAWASTYGVASAAAARASGKAPHTSDLQASPAFIYVQVLDIAEPPCRGSALTKYFAILAASGTPTMADAPYIADCSTLVRDYHQPANPPPMSKAFMRGPVHCISASDTQAIKQALLADSPLAYGTALYTDWRSYCGTPVPYVGNNTLAKAKHCMMIIGFDDEIGAWRIQNSEGAAWGDCGYVWMAYITFAALAEGKAFFYE